MELHFIWFIAAIVLVIVEIATAGFGSICFAIGALGSALTAYLGASMYWQLAVFAIISVLAFVFVRPVVLRFLDKRSKDVKTNADALIGRKAVVSETINPEKHSGRVAVDGDDWKAVSVNNTLINKEAEVEIVSMESVILTVREL